MKFFWFSRVDNVRPEMWQIMIEGVVSPHDISFSTRENFEMSFDVALAIRGKKTGDEKWHMVYSSFEGDGNLKPEGLSRVSVTCPVAVGGESDLICDSFEVGIIG
mmetsp:Transcript_45245/g.60047  ORF Transcript_45245/g.60047 Transcript_45245/m.60047 type:complete len:105 (+) Transcript_45245:507-821(+)